ncbi:MBL fold metallo-hydrolase [Streptomyces sp. F63]|uniref:MBL fold metallo-hydrolase n=1 Tax=Streptomyces sp. F63 TaxID=2824887 RepID=UPI001B35F4D3|nr:MBL fold metallo-hydrolase [Streptomyces sp. F63]MBQ0983102.1 MBL fold metallo-hydrolase [Streptomyces sp. F63]
MRADEGAGGRGHVGEGAGRGVLRGEGAGRRDDGDTRSARPADAPPGGRTGVGRRGVLRGAAATGAAALTAPAVTGGATAVAAPRVVSRSAGPFEVLALLDARGTFPGQLRDRFSGASEQDWRLAERIDPGSFGPDGTWRLDFRCYAVRRPGGRVTLVDTGIGPADSPAAGWAPVPGRLPRVLAEAGISPSDVDSVVLTHLHEDHYGWAVGPDGTPAFPEARYLLQRSETAALDPADTAMTYVVRPLRRSGRLTEVDGAVRLCGGGRRGGAVHLRPTPGHTPGHQSVLVDGGHRRIMVTGDVLVHAVQLADPAVAYAFEQDPVTARTSRTRLLAEARARGALLATAHLTRPFVHPGPAGAGPAAVRTAH